MTAYLIDTSVWIRHLRGATMITKRLSDTVSNGETLVTCGPVAMELLAGVNERNALAIDKIVSSAPPLSFDHRDDFAAAARLSVSARVRGSAVRNLVDCLIASIALREADVVLAHCDSDFARIAEVSALRAERWDAAA